MGWSLILLTLLVLSISLTPGEAADGCVDFTHVRCGDICGETCECGAGAEKFDRSNTKQWCCRGQNCTKVMSVRQGYDVRCETGHVLNLTTPCIDYQGIKGCNDYDGTSFLASDRRHKKCSTTQSHQCIKTSNWQDGTHDCVDRSDELQNITVTAIDNATDLSLLTQCDEGWGPGLECGGHTGCVRYYRWCNDYSTLSQCPNLGPDKTTHDRHICSQTEFWHDKGCATLSGVRGVRCSSSNPGECHYPHHGNKMAKTCQDNSHKMFHKGKNCRQPDHNVCKKDHVEVCISSSLLCDLFPNCDGGEDEVGCEYRYREKKPVFSEATFKCYSPLFHPENNVTVNSATVSIEAVRCDKVVECWEGADEKDCDQEVLNICYLGRYTTPLYD